jgi:hypothetical protein
MYTMMTCSFSKLVLVQKSMSRHPMTNHLQCKKQFHVRVDCFFTSPAYSLDPKLIFTCLMVENNVNHVTLQLELTFKLFFWKYTDCTNPVAKATLLCPLVVILYTGPFRLIWRWGTHNSMTTTFTSQRGLLCSSIVCMTISQMTPLGMGAIPTGTE